MVSQLVSLFLVCGADQTLTVENKCPPALTVKNLCPVNADGIPILPARTERWEMVRVHAPGFHIHQCGSCGAQWSHTEVSYGKRSDHMCPACGKGPWWNPVATNTNLEMREVKPAADKPKPVAAPAPVPYTPRTRFGVSYCPTGST